MLLKKFLILILFFVMLFGFLFFRKDTNNYVQADSIQCSPPSNGYCGQSSFSCTAAEEAECDASAGCDISCIRIDSSCIYSTYCFNNNPATSNCCLGGTYISRQCSGTCGSCTPNCTNKCNGESDGCTGTCNCSTGYYCVSGSCVANNVLTDRTCTARSGSVKAAYVTELRSWINTARTEAGMSNYSWTDSTLTNVSIKTTHMSQMCTAITELKTNRGYTGAGACPSSYTSVKSSDINNLCQFLANITNAY